MNPNTDKPAIIEAWGLIAERIASDTKLSKAVKLVLAYERDLVDVSFVPGPADTAYPMVARSIGETEGLLSAIRALTDNEHIRDRRGYLDAKLTTEKHDARDRA